MLLLDLFCGAGGAAMGYHQSGLFTNILGIDLFPQPRYPFYFIQDDVFHFLETNNLEMFDFIHASPPCQGYAWCGTQWRSCANSYFISRIRDILEDTGKPYVIENVITKELKNPLILNGLMFGLNTIRTRYFETSFPISQPPIPKPRGTIKGKNNKLVTCAGHGGHGSNHFEDWRIALQISWMNKKELTQAIPPAYTKYISKEYEYGLKL